MFDKLFGRFSTNTLGIVGTVCLLVGAASGLSLALTERGVWRLLGIALISWSLVVLAKLVPTWIDLRRYEKEDRRGT